MKAYLRRSGIIAPFLLLIYLIIYMTAGWRAGPKEHEVVSSKLDRIEETLNKIGEFKSRQNLKGLKVFSKLLQHICSKLKLLNIIKENK